MGIENMSTSRLSSVPSEPFIFLGGSCNPTTWRETVAIPYLCGAGVASYNPQVEELSPLLLEIEQRAKDTSAINLFVIDNQTRALMSCMEAVELITAGRRVVIAVVDVESGQHIGEERISASESKDLNRARGYLRDVAKRNGVLVHSTVQEAIRDAVAQLVAAQEDGSHEGMKLELHESEFKHKLQAAMKWQAATESCDEDARSSNALGGDGGDESRLILRTRARRMTPLKDQIMSCPGLGCVS